MDSPLDAFSSETSSDAPPRRATNLPRNARQHFRNTRRPTLVNRLRRKLIDAVDWVADTTVTLAILARAPRRWLVTARSRGGPMRRPAWASNERLAVIATAAITSALVSQFTLWMGRDRVPGSISPTLAATAVAPEAAPLPPRLTMPTPATPLPSQSAARTLVLTNDDGAPQDAMLLQDRPVLMDARLVGTSGSSPRPAAPVSALAPARHAAARAIAPRATSSESRRLTRPAAPASLVVITQPEGAHVTINGVGWGVTPLTLGHLPPGAKRVRITKPGYRSEERVVATDPERPAATLRIALREIAARPSQE